MLDGAKGWARFTRITIPMIWGSVIVVLTTITVTSVSYTHLTLPTIYSV